MTPFDSADGNPDGDDVDDDEDTDDNDEAAVGVGLLDSVGVADAPIDAAVDADAE